MNDVARTSGAQLVVSNSAMNEIITPTCHDLVGTVSAFKSVDVVVSAYPVGVR
jgi:hypothetical protein